MAKTLGMPTVLLNGYPIGPHELMYDKENARSIFIDGETFEDVGVQMDNSGRVCILAGSSTEEKLLWHLRPRSIGVQGGDGEVKYLVNGYPVPFAEYRSACKLLGV
jgi:hypothetical protein